MAGQGLRSVSAQGANPGISGSAATGTGLVAATFASGVSQSADLSAAAALRAVFLADGGLPALALPPRSLPAELGASAGGVALVAPDAFAVAVGVGFGAAVAGCEGAWTVADAAETACAAGPAAKMPRLIAISIEASGLVMSTPLWRP